MSELDPQLKRLFKWARTGAPSEPEQAPFGFSTRVLAARRQIRVPTLLEELQQAAWGLACVALATIAFGCLVLLSQRAGPAPAADLPSAVSYVASNFAL
jgi:hypothetical protein